MASLPPVISRRRSAAVFVDVDNGFGCLVGGDDGWLDRLAGVGLAEPERRDLLVRRAYLTTQGHEHAHAAFARAGFEVIDCPPLSCRGKNAADIRIALDVVDALAHPTWFDDFILLSGDSDFTPVLQRIRAHARRTIVVRSAPTAAPYEAVADTVLDVRDLLLPPGADLRALAVDLVLRAVEAAAAPMTMSTLAAMLRADMGDVVDETRWFGCGSLSRALEDPRTEHLRRVEQHLWDPARHAAP